jgi:uncharacterized membrane protein (DUF106 family)
MRVYYQLIFSCKRRFYCTYFSIRYLFIHLPVCFPSVYVSLFFLFVLPYYEFLLFHSPYSLCLLLFYLGFNTLSLSSLLHDIHKMINLKKILKGYSKKFKKKRKIKNNKMLSVRYIINKKL